MAHLGIKRAWRARLWVRIAAGVAAVAVIFSAGVEVGNQTIPLPHFGANKTGLPAKLDYTSVNQVYDVLRSQYDGKLSEGKLLDGLKTGLVNAVGDPYTEYFNAADAKAFNDQLLDGTFSGIGAQLGQTSTGALEIIAPINGSPAAKAGLQAHDVITNIDGKSTDGMPVDTAVGLIRGPKGSKVSLGLARGGTPLNVTITRDDITLPSVTTSTLDGNIGYLQISEFESGTAALVQKAAATFRQQQVKGIVLDLRGDPGGLLQAAIDISSLWLPSGDTVLQAKRGNVVTNTYMSSGNDILKGVPTVVLIDGGSASASEITAGALHDNGAATLVGTTSYGKGVVQQVIQLKGGAEMKVTTESWYRPNGQNINKKGITPDKVVNVSQDDLKNGNDPQKAAALAILQNK